MLHEAAHLLEVLQHLVHIGRGVATAAGDAAPAGGIGGEQVGVAALRLGHGADHRFDLLELLFALLEHPVVDLVHPRDHFHETAQGAHALDQAHLLDEVREVEGGFLELLLHLGHVGQLDLLLGLLNQGQDVAHAEDPAGHPFGVEGLQRLHLFPGTDEFDRCPADLADREGRAAAGVTVELGEHRTGDAHLIVEGAGEFGGLLADHRVHHQQHLIGLDGLSDPDHLVHHRGVDLEATGGVHQDGVEALGLGLLNARGGDGFRLGVGAQAEDLNADLAAEGFQLVDGRRAVDVGTHQQGLASFLLEVKAELGGGGGFTGTLQARHQDNGWRPFFAGSRQRSVLAAHGFHELLVDHLDEFLVRADAPHHLFAEGLLADLFHEVLDHRKADVGFEQGPAHVLECPLDIAFADGPLTAQVLDGIFKPLGELVEHGGACDRPIVKSDRLLGASEGSVLGGGLVGDQLPAAVLAAKDIGVAQRHLWGAAQDLAATRLEFVAVGHRHLGRDPHG